MRSSQAASTRCQVWCDSLFPIAHSRRGAVCSQPLLARSGSVFNALDTQRRALAARAPKIAGAPSSSHDLRIPSRRTTVVIGQKPGKTLQQSPPHFAQAPFRGACGPPAGPMRSVCSSKVACVCVFAMFAQGLRGASARAAGTDLQEPCMPRAASRHIFDAARALSARVGVVAGRERYGSIPGAWD
jgi:hypothetical protein